MAVLGIPQDKWGEAVHAVVVLHEGQRCDTAEIMDWCRSRMAGYKRPQSVRFVQHEAMPRTATGKILHRLLRQQLERA